MSLVPKDEMNVLKPASSSSTTAKTARNELQLQAVAFQINQAANTGEYRTIFQEKMLDSTRESLTSKGYTIKELEGANPRKPEYLISWPESN